MGRTAPRAKRNHYYCYSVIFCFIFVFLTWPQLQVFCRKLAPRGDYVDWRAMLISLLQIPSASLQTLLDVQQSYQQLSTVRPGYILLDQFKQVRSMSCFLEKEIRVFSLVREVDVAPLLEIT